MEQTETLLLEPLLQEATLRRRQLLPVWIKVFCWIFLFTGIIAPLVLLTGLLFGVEAAMALYGMETTDPLSLAGIIISVLFILKGTVAYGLWWEKGWAIELGIIDAIAGLAFCGLMMTPLGNVLELTYKPISLRLELVALIPYLLKLQKLKALWKKGHAASL